MRQETTPCSSEVSPAGPNRLSYKFQRLREQIRDTIRGGEFRGRLPGERTLARRFQVNAKTINKAIGDLCSEGLLVRHVGRGTFVASAGDDTGSAERRKCIAALLPDRTSEAAYRAALLGEIGAALAANGHRLEIMASSPDGGAGDISLRSWTASSRHTTDAILAYPLDPLSWPRGHLSDECIAEALRRHVPIMAVGSIGRSAKLHAVVPDYSAAGFALTEHLLQLGCRRLIAVRSHHRTSESAVVLNGCQGAAIRGGRDLQVLEVALAATGDAEQPLGRAMFALDDEPPGRPDAPLVGIVCVGTAALDAAMSDGGLAGWRSRRAAVLACVLEPGQTAARDAEITSYDFDLSVMAGWAARLSGTIKSDQRPVEVMIEGRLCIRRGSWSGVCPVSDSVGLELVPRWPSDEAMKRAAALGA